MFINELHQKLIHDGKKSEKFFITVHLLAS